MCYEPQTQTPCLLSHKPSFMHAHYSADSEAHEARMLVQEEEHPSDQACDHTSSQSDKPGRHQLLRITDRRSLWAVHKE